MFQNLLSLKIGCKVRKLSDFSLSKMPKICSFNLYIRYKHIALNQRFLSLDVFRGATVALMILVNNPGSWSHIYEPLEHASWHGCTPTDLVFPFFLFAVGNSMAFVIPKLCVAGNAIFFKKVIKRSFLIFIIGLLMNWYPFVHWQNDHLIVKSLSNIRILNVLQRIALCYFFSSFIVYYFRPKGAFVASVILLLIYWILCFLLGHSQDPYSLEGFWGTHLDRTLLGNNHLYTGEGVPFDPEGLASTIPAITQVIFGYLVGQFILQKIKSDASISTFYEILTKLFVIGSVLIFSGLCWGSVFPINKKIWSSSYVVYTSGIAILVISVLIYLIEVRNFKGGVVRLFDIFGKNPLFIYVLSQLLPKTDAIIRIKDGIEDDGSIAYTTPLNWFYNHICSPISSNPNNGSLIFALCIVSFFWIIGFWLDKRKIYVKV